MRNEFEKWWEEQGKDLGYPKPAAFYGFRWGWIVGQDDVAQQAVAANTAGDDDVNPYLLSGDERARPLGGNTGGFMDEARCEKCGGKLEPKSIPVFGDYNLGVADEFLYCTECGHQQRFPPNNGAAYPDR